MKIVKWIAIILASPFALLFLAVVLHTILNNFYLWSFSSQIFDYPLPKGVEIISKSSEVGVLTGNGNHCDFVASLEVRSSVPIENIKSHYSNMTIQPATTGSSTEQGLSVELISPSVVKIEIWDAPGWSGFDFRCT
ncbi:MAG: hypothetical protein KTR17_12200 [Cellvibrionaceae bacterium]|nr:hypothetical protein [Cellvibrionaceae bacterium]